MGPHRGAVARCLGLVRTGTMDDWWGEIDREILKALEGGPMTLAGQGKIRIRLVELVTADA